MLANFSKNRSSGVENDVCGVTQFISTPGKLKNMPDHGGNRTYDFWNASPMLCKLSYVVRPIRVCDISKPGRVRDRSRALIGGGGCTFIYLGSVRLISFEMNVLSVIAVGNHSKSGPVGNTYCLSTVETDTFEGRCLSKETWASR